MDNELDSVADRFEELRHSSLRETEQRLKVEAKQSAPIVSLEEWEQVVSDAVESLQSAWEKNEEDLLEELRRVASRYLSDAEKEICQLTEEKERIGKEFDALRVTHLEHVEELKRLREQVSQPASALLLNDVNDDELPKQEVDIRSEFERMKDYLARAQQESLQALHDELKRVKQDSATREDTLIRQLAHLKTELAVAQTDGQVSEHQRKRLQESIGASLVSTPSHDDKRNDALLPLSESHPRRSRKR